MSETGWQVIAGLVAARRRRLGLKQEELRLHGGPAVSTVSKVERAAQANFPLRTQQQLEHALGWPAGTITDVIESVDVAKDWDAIGPDWVNSLVNDNLPDLAADAGPGETVRRAVELSDAELLAELTHRVRTYAEALEKAPPVPAAAVAPLSPRVAVLDELVRRGRNPGWLLDATGLEVDELLPFLEQGVMPKVRVARRIEKALGWAAGALGDPGRPGADEFVAQLRRAAG